MSPTNITLVSLVLVATIVVLFCIAARLWSRRPPPFTRRGPLLTPAELRFYRALLPAIPLGMSLFVKVRLLDLVDVPAKYWQQFGARASGMHVDFVVADTGTAEPRVVIELDDRSHLSPEARRRDAFKDSALAAAGIPIMRVAVAANYSSEELRRRIVTQLE
jgi:hypothetical protein